jgi:RHS repeat-associated protein
MAQACDLSGYLDDPLGTRRAQTGYAGVLEQSCISLPFGDALSCAAQPGTTYSASLIAPTEQHFTGKERDTESGNDYFGARYYSSTMGRFLSPDWSAKAEPVPYAKLDAPQTLNLYAYVGNNPMTRFDADGHKDPDPPAPKKDNSKPTSGDQKKAADQDKPKKDQVEKNNVPAAAIDKAVQKFKECANDPSKVGFLGKVAFILDLKTDMPEKPEGLNAQMGVSPSDGEVAPAPLMDKSLGDSSAGEIAYNYFAEKQCAKENPYVFLSPKVKLDVVPGDVF